MKTKAMAAMAAVLLGAAAAGVIGTVLDGTRGEPAHANRPTVGAAAPTSTPYLICGPAAAEPWRC